MFWGILKYWWVFAGIGLLVMGYFLFTGVLTIAKIINIVLDYFYRVLAFFKTETSDKILYGIVVGCVMGWLGMWHQESQDADKLAAMQASVKNQSVVRDTTIETKARDTKDAALDQERARADKAEQESADYAKQIKDQCRIDLNGSDRWMRGPSPKSSKR